MRCFGVTDSREKAPGARYWRAGRSDTLRPVQAWQRRTAYNKRFMACCDELQELVDQDFIRVGPIHTLTNGRILNEIDTEYFFAFGDARPNYVGMNYCPFCGRVISRGLWNLEKKKQGK